MNWVGLDVHQKYCVAVVKDDAGGIVREDRVESRPADLRRFFSEVGPEAEVALEACGSWPWIYDTIQPLVRRVVLGHPLKTRLIAEARIKNDRIDAGVLSDLLRGRMLPMAYAAPPSVRDARQLTRTRVALVEMRSGLRVRIRALLRLHGVDVPAGKRLFGVRSESIFRRIALPPNAARTVERYRDVLRVLDQDIADLDAAILERATNDPACRLLQTIPGIGPFAGALLTAEIGDVQRFPSAAKLCAWAGMVPSLHASGGVARYGRITKQGNAWVRWVLCQCATSAVRSSRRFRNLFERVRGRRGRASARMAVARELLAVAYAMLRSGEMFDPSRAVPPPRKPATAESKTT